ncbi:MAG TPA: class I SAM-dependent methyltransferase [Gaiellaceae bacterium]|jgi:predicted O-methyltransferase YrrM|nr:class I SAM-dependent methyltransferase [Gaiellaceae bacterium]
MLPTPPSSLADSLLADTLAAITLRNRRSIALLGYTELCHQFFAAMAAHGCEGLITGVYDPRPDRQGANIGGFAVASLQAARDVVIDLVCVCADADKEDLLRAYVELIPGTLPDVVLAGDSHFTFRDPLFASLTEKKLVRSTATGSPHTLIHLYECLRNAARLGARGAIVEFGMYKGGTTVMLAKMASTLGLETRVIGFDAFTGFPMRRSLLDLYADPVCEFTNVDEVQRYCAPYGIEIVAGDISETYRRLESEHLMLSFFDTDNYSPTKAALPLCIERTIPGGSIVFDHVYSSNEFRYTLGERMAAYEMLADSGFFHLYGTGVFTRIH